MQIKDPELPVLLVYPKKFGFITKTLCSFFPLSSACFSCQKYFLLSNRKLFSFSENRISKIPTPILINKIAASKETVLLVPDQGLFYQGFDILSNEFSYTPKAVSALAQVHVCDASIGLTHAGAIDDLGNLYLWGNTYGQPKSCNKVFTCSKVLCGDFITCFTTSGGYFYVHGWFGEVGLSPFSLQELEKYFIVDFCIGNQYCAVVTDDGLVLGFDSSHSLIPLKTVSGFVSIHAVSNGIFVVTTDIVYKWTGTSLKDWQVEGLSTKSGFHVIGEANNGVILQGELDWEYKTDINSAESIEKLISPKSINSEKKIYSQYFPQDNTYTKLLEYRKQHKIAAQISAFLKPPVFQIFSYALEKIKKFSDEKKILTKTRNFVGLPAVTFKVLQKLVTLDLMFAVEMITRFVRAQVRRDIEARYLRSSFTKARRENFFECFKRIAVKEKMKFGERFFIILKSTVFYARKRDAVIRKLIYYSRKIDRISIASKFFSWRTVNEKSGKLKTGIFRLNKLCVKKLGGLAFRLVKSYYFYKALKLNTLKKAIYLIYKKTYINLTISYFQKWLKIGIKSSVLKEKSLPLYRSLAKNIFSVLNHKCRQHLKLAFFAISQKFKQQILIKKFKSPLLYFSTIISKVLCRLKFSTFTSLQRLREKTSFSLTLNFSGRLGNLIFLLESLYDVRTRLAFSALTTVFASSPLKTYPDSDSQEQTLTFSRKSKKKFETLNQTIPKLQLDSVKVSKKPPVSSRNSKGFVKLDRKTNSRSGSFGGVSREDSLSRRKNYDNQLRKKIKDTEKSSSKGEVKIPEKIIAKKPPIRKPAGEKRIEKERFAKNEDFLKFSLAILGIKKFLEKNEFTLMLATFKILKSCFKHSKTPYSKYLKFGFDRSNIFN